MNWRPVEAWSELACALSSGGGAESARRWTPADSGLGRRRGGGPDAGAFPRPFSLSPFERDWTRLEDKRGCVYMTVRHVIVL